MGAERSATCAERRTQMFDRPEIALDRTENQPEREKKIIDAHVRGLPGDLLAHERADAFDRRNLGGILPRELRGDIERPLECVVECLKEQRPIEISIVGLRVCLTLLLPAGSAITARPFSRA